MNEKQTDMQAKIKVKNGYWTYNGKPLVDCTFPQRQIVAQFIRNSIFDMDIKQEVVVKKTEKFFFLESNYNFEFLKI